MPFGNTRYNHIIWDFTFECISKTYNRTYNSLIVLLSTKYFGYIEYDFEMSVWSCCSTRLVFAENRSSLQKPLATNLLIDHRLTSLLLLLDDLLLELVANQLLLDFCLEETLCSNDAHVLHIDRGQTGQLTEAGFVGQFTGMRFSGKLYDETSVIVSIVW